MLLMRCIRGKDKTKLNTSKFESLIKYLRNLSFSKYVYRNTKVGRLVIAYTITTTKNMMVNRFFALFHALCCRPRCLRTCVRSVTFREVNSLDSTMSVLWTPLSSLDSLLAVFVPRSSDSPAVRDIVRDNLFCLYFS